MVTKLHKDIEILVDGRTNCKSFEEASAMAIQRCLSDGSKHDIAINFMSEAGARTWGGDDAVESYLEDPGASSHERIVVKVDYIGRVA